ncbi:MAG: PorP/SprF family type IX secretion system membrane protein [Saprospiraceae bacterium]
MKHLIYLTLFSLVGGSIAAQQLPLFTQYREYYGAINPASLNIDYLTSSTDYNASFGISYRTQWLGKDFGPKTAMARGEFIFDLGNAGLITGLQVTTDQTGPTSLRGAYGRVGFIIGNPYTSGISIGLSAGFVQHKIDATELNFIDEEDALENVVLVKTIPDVAAGIYYFSRFGTKDNVFYTGLSVPQTLGIDLVFEELNNNQPRFTRVRHFYAIVGFLKETRLGQYLDLSAWIKYVPSASTNLDALARYQIHPNFWIGAGVSSSKTFHLEVGITLDGDSNRWKIGYGYDNNFTSFQQYFGTSHEINLAYSISTY